MALKNLETPFLLFLLFLLFGHGVSERFWVIIDEILCTLSFVLILLLFLLNMKLCKFWIFRKVDAFKLSIGVETEDGGEKVECQAHPSSDVEEEVFASEFFDIFLSLNSKLDYFYICMI